MSTRSDRITSNSQKSRNDLEAPDPSSSRSWYLDPLVASQKREEFQRLIKAWDRASGLRTVLKTDLFEEANGEDQLLFDSFRQVPLVVGIDIDEAVVGAARRKSAGSGVHSLVSDVRDLPFQDGCLDYVISTSTLDHFEDSREIERSLRELARVLREGGRLLVALDNPWNPLYHVLRLVSRAPRFPFRLGKTLSRTQLEECLAKCDLVVLGGETVIHNPRLVSTLLFLLLRRLLGRFSDQPVGWLLAGFGLMRHLPSRQITGCFVAVCAEKPSGIRAPVL